MAHMVALEVGLPTTREHEQMLAGALSMGHTYPTGLRGVSTTEEGWFTPADTDHSNERVNQIPSTQTAGVNDLFGTVFL